MKLIRYIVIIALVAVLGIVAYLYFNESNKTIDVAPGKISNVETMARLCTVEIYNEVPIKDTINNKVLFGIQKQKGTVSFDIENMQIDDSGDTVKIVLPPEIVEVYEATEPNSWQVIDSKGLSLFTRDKLTNEEDNLIKAKARHKAEKLLYKNGTIARARAEGVKNLQTLMEKVYRKPVIVTDPTPQGAHAK